MNDFVEFNINNNKNPFIIMIQLDSSLCRRFLSTKVLKGEY